MAKPIPNTPRPRASSTNSPVAAPVSSTGFAPLVPPGTSAGGIEAVLCADFDRYGTRLVTGGADHRLRMYERIEERWELVDVWRGHNGMILDVKFSPLPSSTMPLFASTGEDLRLKVWAADPTAPISSGRRFYATFSQSAGHAAVSYVALALAAPSAPSPDLLMAAVTRDGVLSLLEPVPEVEQRAAAGNGGANYANRRQGQDWRELDQIFVADGLVQRGTETCFRLTFQPFPTPTTYMSHSSPGSHNISLAVASLNEVRIYPIAPPTPHTSNTTGPSPFGSSQNVGTGTYSFGPPLAILAAGNGRLVRDVAWSPAAHRTSAWIAAAAGDGMVRVYDVAPPKQGRRGGHGSTSHTPSEDEANANGYSHTVDPPGVRNLSGGAFAERPANAPVPASTLTASLNRASQRSSDQQGHHSPYPTTSALFPGAPSTSHLSAHNLAEPEGVAVTPSGGLSPVPGLPPSSVRNMGSSPSGLPRLDAKLVAELSHPGVWRVAWVRTGAMVVSIGDSGQGRLWGPGAGGNWIEYAEFGAEDEGD